MHEECRFRRAVERSGKTVRIDGPVLFIDPEVEIAILDKEYNSVPALDITLLTNQIREIDAGDRTGGVLLGKKLEVDVVLDHSMFKGDLGAGGGGLADQKVIF